MNKLSKCGIISPRFKLLRGSRFNRGVFSVNVTVDEIQRDPLKYLRQVEAGEIIIIIRSHQAIAELKPIITPGSKQLQLFGFCAGEFIVPDDFDAPSPEEIWVAFEGQ